MESKHFKNRSVLRQLKRAITSESFIGNFILLVVTALLTGLIIPYVIDEIQRNKARNDLALEAHNRLLEDIAKTILTYETLLLDVSWFKTPYAYNEQMHQKAYERYQDSVVALLAEWRVESAKAKLMSFKNVSAKLDSFQVRMFDLQDTRTNFLYNNKATSSEWMELHKINMRMLSESVELIDSVTIVIRKKQLDTNY